MKLINNGVGLRLAALAAAAAAVVSHTAVAQVAPPNANGISWGHVHMFINDPEPFKKLFVGVMGGYVTNAGSLELLRFPGSMIIVSKTRVAPTEGSEGSTVPYIAFKVKDYADIKGKLVAGGATVISEDAAGKSALLGFPEKLNIRIVQDASIAAPAAFRNVRIQSVDPEKLRAWYLKTFPGGVSGTSGNLLTLTYGPGQIEFEKVAEAKAATKGRSLDHIGFEILGLEAFCKKLEGDSSVVFDTTYREMAQLGGLKLAYVVDPVGTRIELTEGFINK
jgi:hypothetical protein